ncbi:MAG TPA: hypothetical protein PKE65_03040 [Rhizobiaceae bacterium]|nr:hypothetical protein [Rhizobiaceae bacterium]
MKDAAAAATQTLAKQWRFCGTVNKRLRRLSQNAAKKRVFSNHFNGLAA